MLAWRAARNDEPLDVPTRAQIGRTTARALWL